MTFHYAKLHQNMPAAKSCRFLYYPKFKLEVQIQMQKKEEIHRPLPKVNYICIAHVQTVNSGAKIHIRSVAQKECEENNDSGTAISQSIHDNA